MSDARFPPLPLDEWKPTRDSLHQYARVLGDIRRAMSPYQKHSWHGSLSATATGLTTTPIPAGEFTFETALDLKAHRLAITTSRGEAWHEPLTGQSPAAYLGAVLGRLGAAGIRPEFDHSPFTSDAPGAYDRAAVERFWQALSMVDIALKRFKGEQRRETGPVVLWPHGFDVAVLWFSGRLIPGQDPKRASRSDEQMNFGFSTGDAGIPEPYFYATAYPTPEGFIGGPLPAGGEWYTASWKGGLLRYEALLPSDDSEASLLEFLRAAHQLGSSLMK